MQQQFVLSEQEFEQIKTIKDILMSLYFDFQENEEPSNYTKQYTIKAYNVLDSIIYGDFNDNTQNLDDFELSK